MNNWVQKSLDKIGWGKYQNLVYGCCYESLGLATGCSFLLSLVLRDLKDISNQDKGILGSSLALGLLISSFLFGRRADTHGRLKILNQGGQLTLVGLTSLIGLSVTFASFAFSLFILGLGVGAEMAVNSSMLFEILPTKNRNYMSSLSVSMNVGSGFVYLIAIFMEYFSWYPTRNWKMAGLIFCIIRLISLYFRRNLLESPAILNSQGKPKEAGEILQKIAAMNGKKNMEFVTFEDEERKTQTKVGITVLFRSPLRSITFYFMLVFFLCFLAIQGIVIFMPQLLPTSSLTELYFILLIQQVGGIPGKMLGTRLIDGKLGRKYTIVIGFLLACIAVIGLALFENFFLLLLSSLMLTLSFNFAVSGLYAITPESFPTEARSLSLGFLLGFSRLGSMASNMLTGIMLDKFGQATTIYVISFILCLTSLSCFGLKETKVKTS